MSSKMQQLVDDLVVDIKSLSLLAADDSEFREIISKNILGSVDEDVLRFAAVVAESGRKPRSSMVLSALGQMTLASIMVVAGLVMLVPVVTSYTSSAVLSSYYAQIVSLTLGSPTLQRSILSLVASLLLLVGAFAALRTAAQNLREGRGV